MNLYLYLFTDPNVQREKVTEYLNTQQNVNFWFYSLPESIFIKTTLTARQLSDLLEAKFGKHRHIVVKVTEERWGRLPKDHWQYFP